MAITVKHTKVSTIPDGDDTSVVRPSDWNADHQLVGLGTMAEQNANAVAITGGTVSNSTLTSDTVSNNLAFTPTTAPSYLEGKVWYDSTEKALAFYNDSSALAVHVGQDLIVKVINNTGSTIPNGSPVYVTGTSSGQTYPNVALAKADVAATSSVIGLTNGAIANGAIGYVTSQGTIDNVNTGTFTVGQVLYLSPYSAGQLMNTVPPTGITVQVGVVSYVDTSAGHIYVKQTTPLAVPASIITGTLGVPNGGTGATTLTGYVKGSGTSAMTASSTIPTTDLSGTVTNAQLTNSAITINGTSTSLGGSINVGTVTAVTGTSPVTSTGGNTPAIGLATAYGDTLNPYASKTANNFLAAPNGSAGAPTFRAMVAADVPTLNQNTTGSAATLTTGRTIAITGDLAYTSPSFDGSANVTAAGTLATVNSNVGTFTKITVNGKGLATAASQASLTDLSSPTASFSMGSQKLTNLLDPTATQDAATKNYVDSVAQGLNVKSAVLAATTASITLVGGQVIDGVTVVAGDRVLVKNQSTASANGLYNVQTTVWTRTTDADTWNELVSAFVFVEQGTTQSDTGFVCTADPGGTLGVTAVNWTQFSGAGTYTAGTGLTLTGTQFSITNTGTAGTYGSATLIPVITTNAQGQITSVTTAANPQGTVTSVTGTAPVVSSGGATPAISLAANYGDTQNPYASKTANFVLSAPNGSAGTPTFRAIVAADIPTLNQNTTGTASNVTGTVAIANGGTGQTTAVAGFNALNPMTTTGDMIYESSPTTAVRLPIGTTGQVLTVAGGIPAWSAAPSSNITTQGLYENSNTISANYTIGTGNNAMSAGPITVNNGVTVTVPTGSTWTIV